MTLERENILTLIGSKRYHSCILTTFSFDFYFFEMKAMKYLRSRGVRNINVFIDGHYYSEILNNATGEEMQLSPGYSLYPIFQKSIFHPKIWMLFGDKEGLLIVGSGNLTSSGNGINDEIWGAFHLDILSTENAPIFSAAWNYLSIISAKAKGQMFEKTTRWIVEHSKWLNELPTLIPFEFSDTSQKDQVAFLFNSKITSIWEELLKHIITENIIEITSLSPYYDKNGKILQELNAIFPDAKINVILEESGLIPSSLQICEAFKFYDWRDVGISKFQNEKLDITKSKLHGKVIHFKAKNGKEFCLFGSANVTPEGMGFAVKDPNAEVSLLIKTEKGGLLNMLGLNLTLKKSKNLSEFKMNTSLTIYETVIKNNQFKVHLLSAELIYDELLIHTSGDYSNPFLLVFFDKQNKYLSSLKIPKFEKELKIKLSEDISKIQYIQLADITSAFLSNKLIVSDFFLIAKTHPNPKTEDLERIYSEIQNGELNKILDLLHFAIIDQSEKDEETNNLQHSKNMVAQRANKEEPVKLYDLSTYIPTENITFEKNLLLFSLSLRVLDVLKFIHNNGITSNKNEDLSIYEQEMNLSNISGNEAFEILAFHNQSLTFLKLEQRKLISYFDNLYKQQQELIYGKNQQKDFKPSLTELTKYLIALELLLEYGGKSKKYDEHEIQHFFSYLPFIGSYDNDNVKGCCLNLIGDFLMLIRNGFRDYEYSFMKRKLEQLKDDALVNTIVSILNNIWKDNELHYFNLLLLNTMHYLGWKVKDNFNNYLDELFSKITLRIYDLKYKVSSLDQNLAVFQKKVCPSFNKVITRIAEKNFDSVALKGQIIYKSPWGYCYVHSITKTKEFTLVRPGFLWDKKKADYLKHSADEIYSPLKISSFICIDL